MIAPVILTTFSLLGKIPPIGPMRPITLAKRIHNSTHVTAEQIIRIYRNAGRRNGRVERSIRQVCDISGVCPKSGTPSPSRKVSLNLVNQAFNNAVQSDFRL